MISVVNGYVCMTSCEVASAKQGKNPSAPPGSPPGASDKNKVSGFASQPATNLDGSLANTSAVNGTDIVREHRLDRLV